MGEGLVQSGKGDTLMSEKMYGFVPISASRHASLSGRGGPDDMFSSDFSEEELTDILGHMGDRGQRGGTKRVPPLPSHPGLKTLFVFSGSDEYVPMSVDVPKLAARMVAAAG